MGHKIHTVSIAAILACLGAPALGQNAQSDARAEIVSPLTLVKVDDLDFGNIVPGGTAGTVSINAQTGARTSAGGAIPAGGAPWRATFVAIGIAGRVVSLSLDPSPNIILTRVSGTETMSANQLRVSVDGGGQQPVGPNHTMGVTGTMVIGVGGQLNVAANQAQGFYTGSFDFTANYQ